MELRRGLEISAQPVQQLRNLVLGLHADSCEYYVTCAIVYVQKVAENAIQGKTN